LEELSASIFRLEQQAKQATNSITLPAYCLFGLPFDPKDGGSAALRNVGKLLPDWILRFHSVNYKKFYLWGITL
jgi:hypothetical protein